MRSPGEKCFGGLILSGLMSPYVGAELIRLGWFWGHVSYLKEDPEEWWTCMAHTAATCSGYELLWLQAWGQEAWNIFLWSFMKLWLHSVFFLCAGDQMKPCITWQPFFSALCGNSSGLKMGGYCEWYLFSLLEKVFSAVLLTFSYSFIHNDEIQLSCCELPYG